MEFRRDASMLNVSSRQGPRAWGGVGDTGLPLSLGPSRRLGPTWSQVSVRAKAAAAPALPWPGPAWGQGGHGAAASAPSALGFGRTSCPTSTRG